jgi:hypothetical protein
MTTGGGGSTGIGGAGVGGNGVGAGGVGGNGDGPGIIGSGRGSGNGVEAKWILRSTFMPHHSPTLRATKRRS